MIIGGFRVDIFEWFSWCFCNCFQGPSKPENVVTLYCATIALGGYSPHLKIHYSRCNLCLYMRHHLWRTLAIYNPVSSLLPSITSSWFYFCQSQATHGSHPSAHHISLIYHTCCIKRGSPTLASSYHFWKKLWMWWKMRQWRFLMETRCHSETIGWPLAGTYLSTTQLTLMYPPFLDL